MRSGAFGGARTSTENYCAEAPSYRGADLNRNFDFMWDCCGGSSDSQCSFEYHGASPASEPEVLSVQNYIRSIFPDQRGPNLTDAAPDDATGIYLDIHSSGRLILHGWHFTTETPAPNAPQLQTLAHKLAYFNRYTPGAGDRALFRLRRHCSRLWLWRDGLGVVHVRDRH